MRLVSLAPFLVIPAIALAAACGGGASEQAPIAPPPPPAPELPDAAPSAVTTPAPAETATPAPTDAGAPTAQADAAPPAAPSAADSVPAPPKPWDQMDKKERLALMKTVILPNMKTAFQNFDAKDFKDFTCVTCHGPGAKKGKFDMPNPGLPKLDFKNGLKDDLAKHPETVKFMHEVVTPQMVKMLGVDAFDMKTMKGFGCGGCHTAK